MTKTRSGRDDKLLSSLENPSHERSLPSMLKVVGYHANEPHAKRDRRIPRLIDDAAEVGVGERAHIPDGLLVHPVVIPGEQLS